MSSSSGLFRATIFVLNQLKFAPTSPHENFKKQLFGGDLIIYIFVFYLENLEYRNFKISN